MYLVDDQEEARIESSELIERITSEQFESWYHEREFRQNIENGTPYFNGPGKAYPSERHRPSSLLKCHRKTVYQQLNAPEEQDNPQGILWFGSRFEEDIALPFLREAVTGSDTYACNTLWVDFTVETPAGEIRIKGATDPVIVDRDSKPILLTEIKTKSSVGHVESPNEHHRAQAHAYMYGLAEKYDQNLTDAVILYGSRESLNVKACHIEFDPEFWANRVVEWATTQTEYRLDDELPPAKPEHDWECEFCSFRHRCGEADTPYSDTGVVGLLPLYAEYPKTSLVEYLKAHDGAKLTPTLAHRFPELADAYAVFGWSCSSCGTTYEWDAVEWVHDGIDPPICPNCRTNSELCYLSGPSPSDQHTPPETKDDD